MNSPRKPGTGEILGEQLPLLCAVSGLFDHLAFGGGQRGFPGLNPAGREFQEELPGGVAVLTFQNYDGIS